jgi:hypothetical protein
MSRNYRDFGVAGRADCGTRKVGMVQSLEAQTRRCSAGSEDATTCAVDSGASYWSPFIESSMVRQSRAAHTLPPQDEVSRGSRRCAQRRDGASACAFSKTSAGIMVMRAIIESRSRLVSYSWLSAI